MKLPVAESPRLPNFSRWLFAGLVACSAIAVTLIHFSPPKETQAVAFTPSAPIDSTEPIRPIEALTHLNPQKIELGQKLFNDKRLSHDNQVACANCHDLKTGGTDRKVRSIGIHGAVGIISAPS